MPPAAPPSWPTFLRAEWRLLAMLNYEIEAATLGALPPRGTELDLWNGRAYVSLVGFLFLNTRVLGLPIPLHRSFEEVNLRFYVRRKAADGWRRGVAFVREFVPRAAIAWVARALYNENYSAVPMGHLLENGGDDARRTVAYDWRAAGTSNRLSVTVDRPSSPPAPGGFDQFIAEHYWGYSRQRDGGTVEYRVDHPPWSVSPAGVAHLDCDVTRVYGAAFSESLSAAPTSAFPADGSEVSLSRGSRLE